MLPLLLAGAGIVGSAGSYLWGKKQGEVIAYKDMTSNEPAISKLMKSANSLIITIALVGVAVFLIKKFK